MEKLSSTFTPPSYLVVVWLRGLVAIMFIGSLRGRNNNCRWPARDILHDGNEPERKKTSSHVNVPPSWEMDSHWSLVVTYTSTTSKAGRSAGRSYTAYRLSNLSHFHIVWITLNGSSYSLPKPRNHTRESLWGLPYDMVFYNLLTAQKCL